MFEKPDINPEQHTTRLEAGREALLADLEAAGEEGLRIIYYALETIARLDPDDPERVIIKVPKSNHPLSGKRRYGEESIMLNNLVLHSKYKDIRQEEAA